MRAIFDKTNPKFEFYDAAVAGGSGDQARALLSSKLQANQPPDTFQGHAGAELQGYIKGGKLESVSFLFDELQLKEVMPQQLIDQITVDGKSIDAKPGQSGAGSRRRYPPGATTPDS